jgi:hypothetical protein
MQSKARLIAVAFVAMLGCGGGGAAPKGAESPETPANPAEAEAATHPCGEADQVQVHDLHSGKETKAFVPCANAGKHDYSGLVKIETVENGVHIVIDARDDEVDVLGPDVKSRDAVIVYPKGKDKKVSIEVPLVKTKYGYHGDKIVFWDDLEKLSDEGTKIDIAVYDHDKKSGAPSEELHLSVAISTGKSCEKASDENPDSISIGQADKRKELTKEELGAPISKANAAVSCGLPDASHADICVLVVKGRPVGVSVSVTPKNNRIAACMDKRMRSLSFPTSERPNRVTYNY